jgi:hypothetical protein
MTQRARRRILCLAAALLVPARAAAEPRLVAVDTDPGLSHAIEVAVASWHVRVVSVGGPTPPEQDMTAAIRAAHRIAREANAQAVTWLTHTPESRAATLWMYDARTHQLAVRTLESSPPYDDATSASVGLTVKTLLASVLENPAVSRGDANEETPTPPETDAPRHTVRVMSYAALRFPTHATDVVAPRVGLELSYFPAWLRGYAALALALDGGPSVLIERPPQFLGTFTDTTVSLALHGRLPLRRWLSVEAGFGVGLHVGTLEGSSPSADLSGRVARVNPALETSLVLEGSWRALRFGPVLGAAFLTHYQRYHVGSAPVFEVPSIPLQVGLRIGVELP